MPLISPPPRLLLETDARLTDWAARRKLTSWLYEFIRFGVKQAWACLFGAAMLALILGTFWLYPQDAFLARYDFLVLAALALQIVLIAARLETLEEAKVILVFHLAGTAMEIFKVAQGSWIYPEPSVLRIAGVPLFSGFMYAAVGSYLARAWRLFDFHFSHYPPFWTTLILAGAAYVNFFSHHYLPDIRWLLFAAAALLYGRCWIYFHPARTARKMPLLLGFFLVSLFIWLAENIGTFGAAWRYPGQMAGWQVVPLAKLGSWFLLMLLSFVLVTAVNRRTRREVRDPSQ